MKKKKEEKNTHRLTWATELKIVMKRNITHLFPNSREILPRRFEEGSTCNYYVKTIYRVSKKDTRKCVNMKASTKYGREEDRRIRFSTV